jgi:hypothetical protein
VFYAVIPDASTSDTNGASGFISLSAYGASPDVFPSADYEVVPAVVATYELSTLDQQSGACTNTAKRHQHCVTISTTFQTTILLPLASCRFNNTS